MSVYETLKKIGARTPMTSVRAERIMKESGLDRASVQREISGDYRIAIADLEPDSYSGEEHVGNGYYVPRK